MPWRLVLRIGTLLCPIWPQKNQNLDEGEDEMWGERDWIQGALQVQTSGKFLRDTTEDIRSAHP